MTPVTCLTPADLDLDTLGSCELTPHELRLLAALTMDAGAGAGAGGGALIELGAFIARAVAAVAVSQHALMDGVYSSGGTQRLLYKLHAQVYPASVG
jgi:hypothetical protein